MRAAVMREGRIVADEVPDPVAGPGQVLVRTIACGICGSDLHALRHADRMAEMAGELSDLAGVPSGIPAFDPARDVVMGHEFSAEVLELGPDAHGVEPGDMVVSMPVVLDDRGLHTVGYSNEYPGGYGERMALAAGLCLPVPEGLDPRHAALTEPMAVGVHAVRQSGIKPGEPAAVIGAGPVGLAVVSALRRAGAEPIVAADFSSARRRLAREMGAHEAVDPREEPVVAAAERLRRPPLHLYEAVGVPGVIDDAMRDAPRGARITVVGVCMEPDRIRPMRGIAKELTIGFSLGYDPGEFASTFDAIASGEVDVAPLVTGEVGIDGVAGAFEALGDPEAHAKILVEPTRA